MMRESWKTVVAALAAIGAGKVAAWIFNFLNNIDP